VNGTKEKRPKIESTPTTPARRALAARAAHPDAGPTTAQLMAAEEARRPSAAQAEGGERRVAGVDSQPILEIPQLRRTTATPKWKTTPKLTETPSLEPPD